MTRLDYTEVEYLLFGTEKHLVPAPVRSAIRTLRVTMHEVVLLIRPGDVPHSPLAIVVNEIRLIDAAALPILVRFKHRRRLIHPFTPIPFEIADRIRTQHIRRTAGVIDSLDRRSPLRIPSHHVRRAVPSSS